VSLGAHRRAAARRCAVPRVESTVVDDKRSTLLSEASLLSAAVALGTNPVAVKYAAGYLPALPFVALRFTAAGLLVLAILRFVEPGGGIERKDLLPMAGLGIIGVGLNNVLFTIGVELTTASDTALIYATPPLWGMVLGFALGTERPRLRGILGVLLAMLGVGVIFYGGLGGGSIVGNLLVSGAAICWGSYTAFSIFMLRRYSPLAVSGYTMLVAGLSVVPFALPDLPTTDWGAVSAGAWAATAYSAFVVAGFGFSAWQGGISRIGANRVLVYQYLITLTGVLCGVLLLGESLGTNQLIGAAVIFCGVYLGRRQ
jgi:drug/metabolite transporter (DMT)-like permease